MDLQIKMKKERQSNIELLRIVSMLLVLVVHAGYWRIGVPTSADAASAPLPTFTRIFVQQLASPCVNIFILISGWFAIKPRLKGILNLWFLLFAWALVDFAIYSRGGGILHIIFPFLGWFIPAYIGLYLVAPVLNGYAEHADRHAFAKYLTIFFIVQTFFDLGLRNWSIDGHQFFNFGYSLISMTGIYLLGRYLRCHPPRWTNWAARTFLFLYIGIFLFSATVQFSLLYVADNVPYGVRIATACLKRFVAYTSPIVIAGTICLFYVFAKLDFKSRIVNHLAMSALGVFCFHSMPFYPVVIKAIYGRYNGLTVLLLDALFIIGVYISGTLIDQVRILVWRVLSHE